MTIELEANGYPLTLIRKVKERVNRVANQGLVRRRENEVVAVASIAYVHGISEAISRIMAPLGIRTVAKTMQRKWRAMKSVKDELPEDTQPGVVYALGCNECRQVYIRETARTAKQRTKGKVGPYAERER